VRKRTQHRLRGNFTKARIQLDIRKRHPVCIRGAGQPGEESMKSPALALSIAFAIVLIAPAHAVVIDFDTLPGGNAVADGTAITDQYSSVGVTFSLFEDGVALSDGPQAVSKYAPTGQQGNRLGNFYDEDERGDVLRIEFSQLVSDISFDFFPQGDSGDQTRVIAYDENGNELSNELTGINGFPKIALFTVAADGVKRIDIFQPADNWNWGIDNLSFTFGLTSVPEPSALTLLAGALIGIGLARRRPV
jgi:hypothetical protein